MDIQHIVRWGTAIIVFSSSVFGSDTERYLAHLKPLFKERCYSCHGALKQQAGLRLDTATAIRDGGKDGTIINVNQPSLSTLMARLTTEDDDNRMPPEGKRVSAEKLAHLQSWIAAGAPGPENEEPEDEPDHHWAFQRIERPALPEGSAPNPIDRFIEANHRRHGYQAQPQAERTLLLRRLYLDLIGLPPTRHQLQDTRTLDIVIDELLAMPQHGERWARHWMDIWRYSDGYGLGKQLRYSQKHLWHWRDWIIESLNADKGYNRMVTEMLAGDELDPTNPPIVRATGFLARNYYLFNRTTWLDATIEHTGKAFLGLTLNCAKCHDHKYDPISMKDYYAFRAIFEPHQVRLDPVPGESDFEKNGIPRVFDQHLDIETFVHQRGNPEHPLKDQSIAPSVPALFASFAPEIAPIPLPREAYAPGLRKYVRDDHIKAARQVIASRRTSLNEARNAHRKAQETAIPVPTDGTLAFDDPFNQMLTNRWILTGDGWEYRDGALHQTISSRDGARVTSTAPHPRDFEAISTYTTTGGDTFKSVALRFDVSEDSQHSHQVYTSAHANQPKLQIAHKSNGKMAYPSKGKVNRHIEVGETYVLKIAVRDTLINVWLNDDFLLAYRLPDRKAGGRIVLSAFDATAAFEHFSVRPLPANETLTEATSDATSASSTLTGLRVARAQLKLARAELHALQCTIAADTAQYSQPVPNNSTALAREAAFQQASVAAAKLQVDIATHLGNDTNKLAKAQSELAKAEARKFDALQGKVTYTSLRGARKALESPADKEADYPAVYPDTSTGRRSALAHWITHRDHPLFARVAVNHIWMRHFGEPLIDSVFDFGRRTPRPEQADLLDWLAVEFIESGWSMKHLHRRMTSSKTYQRSVSNKDADARTFASDPDNHTYWRMNSRRMESQVVRDSLLHLAGTLDMSIGGPSLDPKKSSQRRSLYFLHSRDDQNTFLSMFDDADLMQCYRRAESIAPQQALALGNSMLALKAADQVAEILKGPDFSTNAFAWIIGRSPTNPERAACETYLADFDDPETARSRLVHALFNHNDFVTIR